MDLFWKETTDGVVAGFVDSWVDVVDVTVPFVTAVDTFVKWFVDWAVDGNCLDVLGVVPVEFEDDSVYAAVVVVVCRWKEVVVVGLCPCDFPVE